MDAQKGQPRPPIVVVMGHVDHGKSTLLDYIRKENTVDKEAGGITQHVAAYSVEWNSRKICFIDTPGHAAFTGMRIRGAGIADIAILVVSAEDGVKVQTKEALRVIKETDTPFIVAINKTDRPGADVDRTKQSLAEVDVFVEGYGGDVPVVEISAKTGDGIEELLEMLILLTDMEDPRALTDEPAEGFVLESHRDPQRGISATLLVATGTLRKGMCIASGNSIAPTRTLQEPDGKIIDEAPPSTPISIMGFDTLPRVGATWKSFDKKKEAEQCAKECGDDSPPNVQDPEREVLVPFVIKADTAGTLEAIKAELDSFEDDKVAPKIVMLDVGDIGEKDVQLLSRTPGGYAIGFNVKVDKHAEEVARKCEVNVVTFNIIYELLDWLKETLMNSRPKTKEVEVTAKLKALKHFSKQGDKQLIGGEVKEGTLAVGAKVKIMRRDNELGEGKIVTLQAGRVNVKEVQAGNQLGALVKAAVEIAPGDVLEAYRIVESQ